MKEREEYAKFFFILHERINNKCNEFFFKKFQKYISSETISQYISFHIFEYDSKMIL